MLTPELVKAIDDLRRRGQNYDQVVAAVAAHGVPPDQVEHVVQRYRTITDAHGRPREQINLGDPEEQG